jgi:anti-sigma factor RsiW
MNHQEAVASLDRFLDGELDSSLQAGVERHLAECRACADAVEGTRALRARLREGSLTYDAPASLEQRIRLQLPPRKDEAPWRSRSRFVWRHWMTSAASIIAVAGIAWLVVPQRARISSEDVLVEELTADHVRSLMGNHLTDVASTDQHTVKPWFATRVDFSPEVRDLTDRGFPLIGGRLDYAGGRQISSVVFQRRSHVINLFTWPSTRDATAPSRPLKSRGFNVIRWSRAGLEYAAVSDVDATELAKFVTEFEKG